MAENETEKNAQPQQPVNRMTGGGSTAGISGIGSMSPAERVQYIKELQQTSPLAKISDSIKKLTMDAFDLSAAIFNQRGELFSGIRAIYQKLRSAGPSNVNQHISSLTENVRGVEQLKHEINPQVNVDLPSGRKMEKGLFVDSSWSPQRKGKLE